MIVLSILFMTAGLALERRRGPALVRPIPASQLSEL
jgi:hypothetical protein